MVENEWWLRALQAPKICAIVGLEFTELAYYRDIYVWLPDVRWGLEAMPPCPICKTSERVGFHCWRNNHPGRRICAMDTHYFAISRRYKCHTCAGQAAAMKAAAVAAAAVAAPSLAVVEADGEVDDAALDDEEALYYTFMAWHQASRPLLPFWYGDEFPAFLTHRSGLDLAVLDLQRPLFDAGVRLNCPTYQINSQCLIGIMFSLQVYDSSLGYLLSHRSGQRPSRARCLSSLPRSTPRITSSESTSSCASAASTRPPTPACSRTLATQSCTADSFPQVVCLPLVFLLRA